MVTKYTVDPSKAFRRGLDRASNALEDLTVPLNIIASDFFKSQRAIWQNKGPGQYADLTEPYKTQKLRKWGFVYPILKASGRLEESMINPQGSETIFRILGKKELHLGTKVPYGRFLQLGTKNMPGRPFLFIGPEAPRFAKGPLAGRPSRWLNILNDFVFKKMADEGIKP